MDAVSFKQIEAGDLDKVLDIYNAYVLTSTATFRTAPIGAETLRSFIFLDHPTYKAYLILQGAEIAGFCFLTQYKSLEGYDRTAELGIYLEPACTHRGLGTAAVAYLEGIAATSGIKIIIVSISGENAASLGLFQKLGYQQCGHFKRVGEKFGRVIDVIYFQRSLEDEGRIAPG